MPRPGEISSWGSRTPPAALEQRPPRPRGRRLPSQLIIGAHPGTQFSHTYLWARRPVLSRTSAPRRKSRAADLSGPAAPRPGPSPGAAYATGPSPGGVWPTLATTREARRAEEASGSLIVPTVLGGARERKLSVAVGTSSVLSLNPRFPLAPPEAQRSSTHGFGTPLEGGGDALHMPRWRGHMRRSDR